MCQMLYLYNHLKEHVHGISISLSKHKHRIIFVGHSLGKDSVRKWEEKEGLQVGDIVEKTDWKFSYLWWAV